MKSIEYEELEKAINTGKSARLLFDKVEAIQELLRIQEKHCTSDYQIGLYNGLAIGLSVLTGEEPMFFEFDKKGGENNGISE